MRSNQGIAVAVVLLVSAVALMAGVGAASFAALAARETSASERRATVALFAAESGLNTIVARSKSTKYRFRSTDTSVSQWLARVALRSYSLPGGSRVNLSVLHETSASVTVRSEGIAPDGSRRVVIQDFQLTKGTPAGLPGSAALVTQGEFHSNSAQSIIMGRDASPESWVFRNRELWEAFQGEYVAVRHTCNAGGEVVFKVVDNASRPGSVVDPRASSTLLVTAVAPAPGSCGGVTALPADHVVVLIPFAVSSSVDVLGRPVGAFTPQTINVTDTALFTVGTEIFIGTGTAEITGATDTSLDINWTSRPSQSIVEGTPIRKHVPSVIAEGSKGGTDCPALPGESRKFPEGCFISEMSNIWEKTFPGITKDVMLAAAQANYGHYGPNSSSHWPSGPVSGVTWIDGAQTGDFNSGGPGKGGGAGGGGGALCGEGVVILNTGVYGTNAPNASINLNVSDCEFSGILYVIGDLGIQGNLESFSGTIIVETGVGTRVQGNGEKSFYDPVAIRRALGQLPPPTPQVGFVGSVPASWRFGQ